MVNGIEMDVGGGSACKGRRSGCVVKGGIGKRHCCRLPELFSEL